jgi:peptidoglycan/xylan/chitin deacetylase (PgdA/CDA1 family)
MTAFPNGVEHPYYSYSSIRNRPPFTWPEGARIAFVPMIYFEHLEFMPPEGFVRDPRWKDRFQPDPRAFSWWEYGNRVCIFRILEMLDAHKLRATVAANAMAAENYPYLIGAFQERGYEIAARGISASRMISSAMSEVEERRFIADSLDRIEKVAGVRPTGWFSQDYGESHRTPRMLSEAGLAYVCDWPNDDEPYLMNMERKFVSVPSPFEWDDMRNLWDRRIQMMPRYLDMVVAGFDTLYAEGAERGKFFGLPMHPWLIGAPHRIGYLEKAVQHIMSKPGVWNATASQVASHVTGKG